MLITLERNFQHAQLARSGKQRRATPCPRKLKRTRSTPPFPGEQPRDSRLRKNHARRNLILKPRAPARSLWSARKSKDQKQRSKSNGIRVYAAVPSRSLTAGSPLEAAVNEHPVEPRASRVWPVAGSAKVDEQFADEKWSVIWIWRV